MILISRGVRLRRIAPTSMKTTAKLIIAASEADSNLLYATHFAVPDPVIYFEIKGKKHLVLSDLEIDRAKLDSTVDAIISLSDTTKKIDDKKKKLGLPGYALIVDVIFSQKKIKDIEVPANFPSEYYVALSKLGYKISIKPDPFFESRLYKTKDEKNHIIESVRVVETALKEALQLLQASSIKGNKIYHGKTLVTSELLKSMVNSRMMSLGCVASHTIIASGVQGSYPHHHGEGPLLANTPIIFDIFPRNAHTGYWGDMTRTFLKGKPSDTVKKMFAAVLEANLRAQDKVKPGNLLSDVHKTAAATLEKHGFKTGKLDGRMQGYIHSTGHGLGLDIHEPPSVSPRGGEIKPGLVITIEPGLYYEKHGGIRLEDDLYVTKTGHETLTRFPKFLEVDKLEL